MALYGYLEVNLRKDFLCKIKSSLGHLKGFVMMEHATVKATLGQRKTDDNNQLITLS
jgi:hypothetical protein